MSPSTPLTPATAVFDPAAAYAFDELDPLEKIVGQTFSDERGKFSAADAARARTMLAPILDEAAATPGLLMTLLNSCVGDAFDPYARLRAELRSLVATGSDAMMVRVADALGDMRCRNSRLTEGNLALSGVTGSNATPLPLAVGAAAKLSQLCALSPFLPIT